MNMNTPSGSFSSVYCTLLLFISSEFLFSNNNPLVLTCPADVTVQLAAKQCDTQVFFEDLAWSSTEPVLDTVFLPPSGTTFGIGNQTVTLAVTTVSGVLQTCTFKVNVIEFFPSTLDCRVSVQINLNDVCEAPIPAASLLMLDSTGCINNYIASRLDANNQVLPPIVTYNDIGKPPFMAVAQHISANHQCITDVTVTGNLPPAITCPPSITVPCNTPLLPSITGWPDTTGCFENISLTYTDQMVNAECQDALAFQVTRKWTATDPLGKVTNCQHLISASRVNIAGVVFPPDLDGTSQPVLACSDGNNWQTTADPVHTGRPTLGGYAPNTNLACDVSVSFMDFPENICGQSYYIQRVWTVVNFCDQANFLRDTQHIFVLDTLAPMFSVPDTLFASTDASCFDSLLLPEIVLKQECSGFSIEIITPWDTLHTNGGWTPVTIDSSASYPITYTLTDECGLVSVSQIVLHVDDETLVGCPPPLTIDCDEYYSKIAPAIFNNDFETLNKMGVPSYYINCGAGYSQSNQPSINNCGVGTILRTFEADNNAIPNCTQLITVGHVSNFSALFPMDIGICTSPSAANLAEPEVAGVSCENMTISFTDAITQSGVPGCYTVKRTWSVANSCKFNGNNTNDDLVLGDRHFQDGGDGIIRYIQTITVNDRPGPSFPNGCGFPDLHVPQNNCEITVTVPTPQVEGCTIEDLFLTGDLGIEMGKNVKLSPGIYEMTYTAMDECGKTGVCSDTFAVLDTVAPMAKCKQNLVVQMLPTNPPMVEIWAIDFNDNSTDNCSGALQSFFLENGDLSLNKVFDDCCTDLGMHSLTLLVEDAAGNQSTCQTSVMIQMNQSQCDCSVLIAGNVSTEDNKGIKNVQVTIKSPSGFSNSILTNAMGDYSLAVMPDSSYAVTPFKNDNHGNGVTTFDAALITRHILGVQLLDSPYKIIAADINRSNTVTTFDIVELRKLILNINTQFPVNTSWRFVPADFVFTNPTNPFSQAFPEVINMNNVNQSNFDWDFIGIKVGDVNGSAMPE